MPTHKTRYQGSFYSENGRYHIIKIYDKKYSGTKVPIKIGGGGVKIKYDTNGQEKFSPIVASKCSISLIVEDNVYGIHVRNFLKGLRETYEEGDATVVIWNTGSTQDTPLWSGNILIDLSAKEDVSKPYEVELSATDGIGILKNYDMVATQGSSPYASADTYISDGYQTFIYWIKTILAYCNTPDSDSTDGDVSDYTFSTSVDWWYQDHPTPTTSISPLAYTQCQMMGGYEVTQDGTYRVKSVYDVLESFCKMWGMKVVFWKNRFYFTQLELYNTAETGTFSVPDNVDSQIWTKAGVLSTGRSYLGEPNYTAYSQDIETNAGGFDGGLQKLAGSKWDYYPKLKEVVVNFSSISNNNYFQTFPQPTTSTTSYIDLITSSPIATITGASGLGGFNISLVLEFNSSWPTNEYCDIYWGVRAKPAGDPNFLNGYYISNIGNNPVSWSAWPSLSTTAFYSQGSGYSTFNCWIFMLDLLTLNSNGQGGAWAGLPIPPGISQQVFACTIPTDSNFTGDWDFEFFTYGCKMPYGGGSINTPAYYIGHMSTNNMFGWLGSQIPYITYSDVYDTTGSPLSQFNPILNSVIGGDLQTSVYSARSETQKQEVKGIWWGDTPTNGEPSSLIWTDDVGGSGYTDPNGLWRNGQTGSFDKLIQEVLGESRLYNQQQSDYKWSLGTAVSETNSWKADASGSRPVYVNPIGRIHDTIDNIFYYLLRGTFNIVKDEWEGEWLQVSFDDGITTTTTTTGSGGSQPSGSSSARLAAPNTGSLTASLDRGNLLTTLSADLAEGTITSLSINPFNDESGVPSQSDIIKAGDIFILRDGIKFYEFTASVSVGDTDTTISVDSTVTIVPISKGAAILTNNRDLYQQYQHKTRGTINISQYSFTERSTDPYFPSAGNSVMWMSDGTASGDDGDMLITINTGAALTTSKLDLTAIAANAFTFTVDTTASGSASDTFVLPLVDDGTIDIYVNWGDGNSDIITTYNQTEITHQYSAGGTYSVTMQGTIRGFRFADAGDKEKMRVVSKWGDLNITQTMAFKGCLDMTCTASDAPTILDITDLNSTFSNCTDLTGIGGAWDMSAVTNLESFFYQCSKFNQDISAWNVSSCSNFDKLFYLNVLFNQDIGGWNTGSATTMVDMLDGNPSGAFDQDISSWDIADVTDFGTNFMREQTLSTANYDALLIAWDGQSVQSGLTLDFGNSQYTGGGTAAAARANLISSDSWTISDGGAVVVPSPFTFTVDTTDSGSASDTFVLPLIDDGDINIDVDWGDATTDTITAYDDAAVTHVYGASGTYTIEMSGTIRGFRFAGGGDRRKMRVISQWGDFNMTQANTFQDCRDLTVTASDAPTISTTSLAVCFYRCADLTDLGTGISSWDVSSVTNFYLLFYQATKFNGDVSSWDVGNVTTFQLAFWRNDPFNADISGWDTSSATNMNSMLKTHLAPFGSFNQNISAWDISNVTDMTSILQGQTLSTANYDALLIGWDAQSVTSGLSPNFGSSTYTGGGAAAAARANLISSDGWTITDGGIA